MKENPELWCQHLSGAACCSPWCARPLPPRAPGRHSCCGGAGAARSPPTHMHTHTAYRRLGLWPRSSLLPAAAADVHRVHRTGQLGGEPFSLPGSWDSQSDAAIGGADYGKPLGERSVRHDDREVRGTQEGGRRGNKHAGHTCVTLSLTSPALLPNDTPFHRAASTRTSKKPPVPRDAHTVTGM